MKKLISCTLAIVLCLTLSVSSFAANNSDDLNTDTSSFVDAAERKIADILGAVEIQKADYGLSGVDFSTLSLGREIPSYELTKSGLTRIKDIHIFPIIYNNNWIATAIVSYSIYGDMNIEFSVKYAVDYSRLKSSAETRRSNARDGVALVFDSKNAYLYSGDDSIVVESFQEIQGRESMKTYTGSVCPETAQVVAQRPIDTAHLELARDSIDFVSLNISSITQPTPYTCWAASTAMILNYRGTFATVGSVLLAAYVDMYTFRSAVQCSYLISNSFNYPCGLYGLPYGYYYNLTINDLITELYGLSSPLFAGFGSGSVGHAVVVKGYVNLDPNLTPTMTYIDPADEYIKASSVPANGAVTIPYGGSSHGLLAAFAVYEQ